MNYVLTHLICAPPLINMCHDHSVNTVCCGHSPPPAKEDTSDRFRFFNSLRVQKATVTGRVQKVPKVQVSTSSNKL